MGKYHMHVTFIAYTLTKEIATSTFDAPRVFTIFAIISAAHTK